jgi:hypothetical protein
MQEERSSLEESFLERYLFLRVEPGPVPPETLRRLLSPTDEEPTLPASLPEEPDSCRAPCSRSCRETWGGCCWWWRELGRQGRPAGLLLLDRELLSLDTEL